jgi:hypothetical protein
VPGTVAEMLQDEAGRLERLLALFRLLPLDRHARPEPLHLPDLLPAVSELAAHHPAFRDADHGSVPTLRIEPDPDAPPVLAPHSALTHALVALAAHAARAGAPDGVRVAWRAAGDSVTVTVAHAAHAAPAAAVAAWLLGASAVVEPAGDGVRIVLPTLAAGRVAGG